MVSTYPPQRCGIGYYTKDIVETLLAKDQELEFFVLAESRSWIPYRKRDYNKIHEWRIWDRNNPSYPLKIFNAIQRIRPNIVWVQHEYGLFGSYGGFLLLFLFGLLRLFRFEIIMTLHTVCPRRRFVESLQKTLRYSTGRLILRYIDIILTNLSAKIFVEKVIVHSTGLASQMGEDYSFPKDKIEVIPHGVYISHNISPERAKENLNLNGKHVILSFGFLSYRKGYEYVIEAVSQLSDRRENLVYLVAGTYHTSSGVEYLEELKSLVRQLGLEKNVKFYTKTISEEEVPIILGAADIVVLPYLSLYGDSGVLRQAATFGKPVIVTSVGAMTEEIKNGVSGLIVPPANVENLKEAIEYLLRNPEEAKRMGLSLRNKAITEWSWQRISDHVYSMLQKLFDHGQLD